MDLRMDFLVEGSIERMTIVMTELLVLRVLLYVVV